MKNVCFLFALLVIAGCDPVIVGVGEGDDDSSNTVVEITPTPVGDDDTGGYIGGGCQGCEDSPTPAVTPVPIVTPTPTPVPTPWPIPTMYPEPIVTPTPAPTPVLCDFVDNDGDGVSSVNESCQVVDCDDSDPSIYPGAIEVCDGIDKNCDGSADSHLLLGMYADNDGDGYGDSDMFELKPCGDSDGYTGVWGDCDDSDQEIHPSALEECSDGIDQDCDGQVDDGCATNPTPTPVPTPTPTPAPIDLDGDGRFGDSDCDDGDATVYSGASEICDAQDNDCDGGIDEGGVCDSDGDGFSDEVDCDDSDATIHPGASEVCDGIDEDCDGQIDEGLSFVQYPDLDVDGYGDGDFPVKTECLLRPYHVRVSGDCNDANPSVHPGATEVCNEADDDCDGQVDEGAVDAVQLWDDDDGDGYGDNVAGSFTSCREIGYVTQGGDCNDSDSAVHPGAVEVSDGQDNDCDGKIDEGTDGADDDGDGFSEAGGDCNDADATIHPGAVETASVCLDEMVCPDGADACAVDLDRNGSLETILMDMSNIYGMPEQVAVYENGYGTGCHINGSVVAANEAGYYVVSFAGLASCTSQISLVSGELWWQNYEFCTGEDDVQGLCVQTGASSWLIGIDWRSASGLQF